MEFTHKRSKTNNPVESWHTSVTADTKSQATLNAILEEIQLKQAKTEPHPNIVINSNFLF
jgi:hypothetical protein